MELIITIWNAISRILNFKSSSSVYIAALIIIITVIYCVFKTRNSLPGPIGLPFLGYWPFLKDSNCHLVLTELQKKYGDLYSFRYAGGLYINMGSIKAAKEIHIAKADCFQRMSDFSLISRFFADGVGVINGEPWKLLRKFSSQQFKELGMTSMKENMSGPMYDSIKETIDVLKSKNGEPVEIVELLMERSNTIIYRTLFGENGITKQEIQEMVNLYGQFMSIMTPTNMLLVGNIARYLILPFKSNYKNALKQLRNMENMLEKIINNHKLHFDQDNPKNYIDAYIKERNEKLSRGDPTAEYLTDKALISTLVELVGDGVLSVAMLLSLFLKRLIDFKEEQEKIYSELIEVVGHERAPTIEDKIKMPYTNSLLFEIMRKTNFFTLFPSQQCIKETTVRGYKVPKGAITLLNIYACHRDSNAYIDPEVFNPTRFIAEKGKPKPDLPVSFGIGKRACIGEGFTMVQVFLYITTILQNFKLTIPENLETGITDLLTSGKMEICALPRN